MAFSWRYLYADEGQKNAQILEARHSYRRFMKTNIWEHQQKPLLAMNF